jgi:hypothetical protein
METQSRYQLERAVLFDLAKKSYFKNLEIASVRNGNRVFSYDQEEEWKKNVERKIEEESKNEKEQGVTLVCRACNVNFEKLDDYQRHYKSDWHM